MKKVKQYEVLEEGCLKLTLASKKEFDNYMFELLNRHPQALPCRMKQRSSVTFLYDIGEKISLPVLLRLYEFEERDAYAFLCQLFRAIASCSGELPLFAPPDCIFYELNSESFLFVILPIHEHSYENDWTSFLTEVIAAMHLPKDSLYGCLCDLCTNTSLSPRQIVEQLRQWQKDHRFRERLRAAWRSWRTQKERWQENDQRLREECQRIRFAQRANQMENAQMEEPSSPSSDTVVLFPAMANGCLKDDAGHRYPLQEQTQIGRSNQCNIVLAHETISLHHACIKKDQNGRYLSDLGSSNGTRINGKSIAKGEAVRLHDQDVITFADYALVYEEQSG